MKALVVYMYSRFERLWHWLQAIFIISLIISGFEIHGWYSILGFSRAVWVHNIIGLCWVALTAFMFFWLCISGEWKQYRPSLKGVFDMMKYYSYGIFKGLPHPFHKSVDSKFNPLQKIAYIKFVFGFIPLQILTGVLFFFFPELSRINLISDITFVAVLHTFIAFVFVSFLIAHLYLITLGHTPMTYLKAMLTGYEEVDQ